jgi:hypothetical protein
MVWNMKFQELEDTNPYSSREKVWYVDSAEKEKFGFKHEKLRHS